MTSEPWFIWLGHAVMVGTILLVLSYAWALIFGKLPFSRYPLAPPRRWSNIRALAACVGVLMIRAHDYIPLSLESREVLAIGAWVLLASAWLLLLFPKRIGRWLHLEMD